MLALRASAYLAFQVMTVVPWALACLVLAPMPRRLRYRFTIQWPRMCIWAARVLLGIRWRVIGAEHLPQGPAILLSKHQSTWETLFYPPYMPRELCFVFKRELLWLPFFGWGIGLLDMIHIDRTKGRDAFEQVVQQGRHKLAEGRWIIMFPEGTRTPVGSQGRYRSGGARLAVRTGTPVVPIAVNSGEFWARKAFIKRPGLITVSIGAPIAPDEQTPDALMARVEQWIEAEMRRLSPHLYRDAHRAAPASVRDATDVAL
ncbi:MAG: 1-acyl-sn-glycerol-3-phosphate acyltransferase [Burkholderiales bacterium]|nr:MAG: 1-acyl-sn-glycerol-3-phosphate acyltransferase [Burkholderiales bacterium]